MQQLISFTDALQVPALVKAGWRVGGPGTCGALGSPAGRGRRTHTRCAVCQADVVALLDALSVRECAARQDNPGAIPQQSVGVNVVVKQARAHACKCYLPVRRHCY